MWKDFFYYTRNERRGIIALFIVIAISWIACWIIKPNKRSSTQDKDKNFAQEYLRFINSLKIIDKQQYYQYYHPYKRQEVILGPFDPNTTDSLTFLRLGLKPWMAHNILKYRSKGGKFRRPDDFRKIYGLTNSQFAILRPYITIAQSKRDSVIRILAARDTTRRYPVKFTTPMVIELNTADTTELKRIPGVGSAIAHVIVNYRQRLGGYYNIRQLEDIRLISSRLARWFTIDASRIIKINVNKASIRRLNAHPYLNFYQAKVIIEHRRRNGPLRSMKQLSLYEEFSPSDFDRLSHYLVFD